MQGSYIMMCSFIFSSGTHSTVTPSMFVTEAERTALAELTFKRFIYAVRKANAKSIFSLIYAVAQAEQ